jgi:hypothetical protein
MILKFARHSNRSHLGASSNTAPLDLGTWIKGWTAVMLGMLILSNLGRCDEHAATRIQSIPFEEIGAEAAKAYSGEGLAIIETVTGARLRCDFQKLSGEITDEGLSLRSELGGSVVDEFKIVAVGVGRGAGVSTQLPSCGSVTVEAEHARFSRPGLVEEFSVSIDGVRQDFLVLDQPDGVGALKLTLSVKGASAAATPGGALLSLANSQRKISYTRLHVTDATGRVLPASLAVVDDSCALRDDSELMVHVNDAGAVYPVRIDPTFSDANWSGFNEASGPNGAVAASVADGSGNLYIGGDFTQIGGVSANRIAKWDGRNWSPLGSGVDQVVYGLLFSNGVLYAGGKFKTAGGISASCVAKWDGTSWSALGAGIGGNGGSPWVRCFAAIQGEIYAGGAFTSAGGISARSVAKWDGSQWSSLDLGVTLTVLGDLQGFVDSMHAIGGDLYVGGWFNQIGSERAECQSVAKWSGGAWDTLQTATSLFGDDNFWNTGTVSSLTSVEGDLIAGGSFICGGGRNLARWDGATWSSMGYHSRVPVDSLAVFNQALHAGSSESLLKWNGSTWDTLETSIAGSVRTLTALGNSLYVGGSFSADLGVSNFGKWNGSELSPLGAGTNEKVNAMAISGTDLYVAGRFSRINNRFANRIAKWNGSEWSALGSGLNGEVNALAVIGTDLYVGGSFTSAGGMEANRIAKWDGVEWSNLGVGTDAPVHALVAIGGDLYAGGMFLNAGGLPVNRIAKWNGSQWSSLGSGMDSFVFALASSGSDLYAGGSFYTAGGVDARFVAKWNGNSWSPLGSGISGYSFFSSVYALAVSGNTVYAGGNFSDAGGVSVSHIAQWNGFGWSAMGAGMDSPVTALSTSGSALYAGGGFSTAGGTSAKSIAKWQNAAWSALGAGTDGAVSALATLGNQLCIGGAFSSAGGFELVNIAKVEIEIAPVITSELMASAKVGQAFSYQIIAENSPTSYGAAIPAPPLAPGGFGGPSGPLPASLPAGLSFNSLTGLISGVPLATGNFLINLSATNGAGSSQALLSLGITSSSPIESWRQQYFGSPENFGNASDLATPDGDSVTNLVRYALNIAPGSNASGKLPQFRTVGAAGSERLAVSFRRLSSRSDIVIAVEASSSLDGPWLEIAKSANGAPFSGTAIITENPVLEGGTELEIADTVLMTSAARRFMRVRVER